MKHIFSRNPVSKMGALWLSPFKEKRALYKCGWCKRDPVVFTLIFHRLLAALSQWWSTCIPCLSANPVVSTDTYLAFSGLTLTIPWENCLQPCLGLEWVLPFALGLLLHRDDFSSSRLGRLLAEAKGRFIGISVLCEATKPTSSSQLHLICKFKRREISQDDFGPVTHLCWITLPLMFHSSLLISRANEITVIWRMFMSLL